MKFERKATKQTRCLFEIRINDGVAIGTIVNENVRPTHCGFQSLKLIGLGRVLVYFLSLVRFFVTKETGD